MSDSMPTTSRRQFLATLGAAGLGAGSGLLLPREADAADWQNWSGSQKAAPKNLAYPTTEDELARVIRQATGQVRAFGGSHSFSGVAGSPDTMISLEALNGIVRHDAERLQATIWAGTRIGSLGQPLEAIGQALVNEADINMQSLGGSISTATHGTGRQLNCYSAYVRELRLVLADGSLVTCSPEKDNDLFQAARVGVGSLGVISQITMQNRATYKLKEEVRIMPLEEALQFVDANKDKFRHVEFFAFPYGSKAIVKWMNISTEADTPPVKPSIDENELLDWVADTARKYPWTNSWLQRTISLFVSDSTRVGKSYEVFASPRHVGFNEMEYSVPAEKSFECLQEVLATIRRKKVNVFFPLEFRFVAADDCWLSPFYQRHVGVISVHQYHKQDYKPLFSVVEPVFWKYHGRPHWGKLHTLKARNFRTLYPRFDDFLAVRRRADPQGKFLNAHARDLFIG